MGIPPYELARGGQAHMLYIVRKRFVFVIHVQCVTYLVHCNHPLELILKKTPLKLLKQKWMAGGDPQKNQIREKCSPIPSNPVQTSVPT